MSSYDSILTNNVINTLLLAGEKKSLEYSYLQCYDNNFNMYLYRYKKLNASITLILDFKFDFQFIIRIT